MKNRRYRLIAKQIMCIVSAIAALCLMIVFATNHNLVQLPGETTAATQSEEELNQIIRDTIDRTVSDWFSGAITFGEAAEILVNIQDTSNAELSDYAAQQLTYITVETTETPYLSLRRSFSVLRTMYRYFPNSTKLTRLIPSTIPY